MGKGAEKELMMFRNANEFLNSVSIHIDFSLLANHS